MRHNTNSASVKLMINAWCRLFGNADPECSACRAHVIDMLGLILEAPGDRRTTAICRALKAERPPQDQIDLAVSAHNEAVSVQGGVDDGPTVTKKRKTAATPKKRKPASTGKSKSA